MPCRRWSPAAAARTWPATSLPYVTAPTLLVVGGHDTEVLELDRRAVYRLRCPHRLIVVEGAGHLFAGPDTLERVSGLASEWFATYLTLAAGRLAAA